MKKQVTKNSQGKPIHFPYITSLIIVLSVIAFLALYKNIPQEKEKVLDQKILPDSPTAQDTPQFIKEGELIFLEKKSRKKIIKIDIEIADNDYERTRGLMYRRSLPENAGMLFIFEQSGPLSFWMRNTYIPLDIIFADENRQIVTIQKNKKPLSYAQIPSKRNSKYVVEVNAGFCDQQGIVMGDFITF